MSNKVYVKLARGGGKSIIKGLIDLLEENKIVFLPADLQLIPIVEKVIDTNNDK